MKMAQGARFSRYFSLGLVGLLVIDGQRGSSLLVPVH